MKSAHRHELETNVLAHRLEVSIMRWKPYASRIVGVIVALIAVVLIWMYIASSSAASRSEAWDKFNQAVGANPPNVEEIHRSAQDFPNTKMQQMADVTWADAQVFMASRNYLSNRQSAMNSLERATSAYQGVIQSSKDERLTNRARLGLARTYEMQNHLEKAREEYGQVTGAYADYAKKQAERLEKPDSKETYAWLATAQPPRPTQPMGPGTPGQSPEFSPGDLSLPAGGADAVKPGAAKGAADPFDELLKDIRLKTKASDSADRYQPGNPPATEPNTKAPATTAPAPESKGAAPPADAPKDEKKPAETPPATEKPAK